MAEQQFYVYTHARPNTNDVHGIFYVGKANKNRVSFVDRKHNTYHTRIVKKYGKENIIVCKLACESEQHAFDLEVQMIAKLREIGVRLSNVTDGGEGVVGFFEGKKKTKEHRKKISEANLRRDPEIYRQLSKKMTGRIVSDETKNRLSIAGKGRVVSEETRKKLSESGRNPSEETRKKISEANKGRKLSEETRKKIASSKAGKKRPPFSGEWKRKISESISIANTGKRHSDEAKRKMSEAAKKRHENARLLKQKKQEDL